MKNEDFDIEKVRVKDREIKKDVILSVRVTTKDLTWLKENKVSASKLFNYILHKIMKEQKE